MNKYATIKRGKVKVEIGSPQFKLLMARKLPLSIVNKSDGHKNIKRMNTKLGERMK
jgi:hypothetical protein